MKIPVEEITPSAKELNYSERIEELNEIYGRDDVRDFEFPPFLDVRVVYYRSDHDLFFQGQFEGNFEGTCSRCLTHYKFRLGKSFDFILTKSPAPSEVKSEELRPEDLGLSYYSSDEINLAPLIREQVLLALPTRPLCRENCLGLCGGCGVNLNIEACVCRDTGSDPRMAIFRTLKIGR